MPDTPAPDPRLFRIRIVAEPDGCGYRAHAGAAIPTSKSCSPSSAPAPAKPSARSFTRHRQSGLLDGPITLDVIEDFEWPGDRYFAALGIETP